MNVFEMNDLSYRYHFEGQLVPALNGVSGRIEPGKLTCLSGPSGSGKSTLLNLLGLLDKPSSGKLIFQGRDTSAMSERERENARLFDLGFIFQSFNLFPVLNARENVEYFLIKQGIPPAKRKELVESSLRAVGIWDQSEKRPNQMSGGQRQRVAIARALAKNPKVILADEPTASLDQKNGKEVIRILRQLSKDRNLTVLIASHDGMVIESADINVKLRDGVLDEVRT
jgi:putative ABC transport system ATP-binding protein